ncbi:MAG: SpoIIE family protein phosphatase [Janthinobacterium lividum]
MLVPLQTEPFLYPRVLPDSPIGSAKILESISDAFFDLDRQWRFTYLNAHAERLLSRSREALLGRSIWAEFPDALGTAFEREYRQAESQQTPVTFEQFFSPLNAWFEIRAYPSVEGLSVYFTDISSRIQSEKFLKESEERLRLATEGAGIGIWHFVAKTSEVTLSKRCYEIFGLPTDSAIPIPYDLFWSMIHFDDVPRIKAALEGSVRNNTQFDGEYRILTPSGITCWVQSRGKPYDDETGTVQRVEGVLMDITPQREALDRLETAYTKVMHDETERKALADERERLATANRLLLESTSEGIYGIDLEGRFTFVNRAAARTLGFTQEQMIGLQGHQLIHHSRPDGKDYPADQCPIYCVLHSGEGIHVEDDVFWRADGTSFPVAYSAAPILEQGELRGAVVTFYDISVQKALDAERDRLAQREHNIAMQLQAALMPTLPAQIGGMVLAKYYEAALSEAGVGGDFYDAFAVEKGCMTLVVGDVSGKGLAAASQVATVRNMLRYAVYHSPTLVGALTNLNSLLVEQDFLSGFATLFVATYDSGAGTLTYVNCGQEPALIRRSTGTLEQLEPTGPILGSFENSVFEEETVQLGPGDAIVVFTDGLTEVGRNRAEMIGIEGVAELLAGVTIPKESDGSDTIAECLALGLIAGIDAAAQHGVTRDDVCLLIGVVQ